LRKAAMCAVLLLIVPLTLIQALDDAHGHWLKVAIVAFIWTLGVGVGTVLSGDLGSEDESDARGADEGNFQN
jgi:hypothetical protein